MSIETIETIIEIPAGRDNVVIATIKKSDRGTEYIDVRKAFYNEEEELVFTSKGIMLTPEQWVAICEPVNIAASARVVTEAAAKTNGSTARKPAGVAKKAKKAVHKAPARRSNSK